MKTGVFLATALFLAACGGTIEVAEPIEIAPIAEGRRVVPEERVDAEAAEAEVVPNGPTRHIDVRGSMSAEVIEAVVARQRRRVDHCYDREPPAMPVRAGRVVIRFIIAPTGSVQTTTVHRSTTLDHEGIQQCVQRVVRRLTFPAPAGGGIVIVTYPFRLPRIR